MRLGCPIGLFVGTLVCLVSLAVAETRLVPEAVPIPKSAASSTRCVPSRVFVKPTDDLKDDASFQRFKRRLVDIAARRDATALYRLLSPKFFEVGCCEDGPNYKGLPAIASFKAMVAQEPNSQWLLVQEAMQVGVVKTKRTYDGYSSPNGLLFCGPATASGALSGCDFGPDRSEGDDMAYVIGTSVPLHAEPHHSARIITSLSWDMVQALPDGWGAPDDSDHWTKVRLGDGTVGYVESRFVHWFLGPTICFRKDATGPWRIAGIDLGGD